MAEFIEVKNFERFQHYKDRKPPWIKLYNDLLDDYEFGCLPDASKWLAVGLWLLASRHDNRVANDPNWIGRMIHASQPVDIAPLVSAGFVRLLPDASKPLAERKQDAMPETEVEREKEGEVGEGKVRALRAGGNEVEAWADQIILAANRGMAENPSIAYANPISLGHGSRQSVMDWLAAGVGWEVARDTCFRLAKEYKPDGHRRQINSMAYFDMAVGEAWVRHRAKNTEVGDERGEAGGGRSGRGGGGTPAAVGGKAHDPNDKFLHLEESGGDVPDTAAA